MSSIPVVDFDGVYSSTDLSSCPQVEEIHSAFTTIGFVFIKNHGIERKLVRFAHSKIIEVKVHNQCNIIQYILILCVCVRVWKT